MIPHIRPEHGNPRRLYMGAGGVLLGAIVLIPALVPPLVMAFWPGTPPEFAIPPRMETRLQECEQLARDWGKSYEEELRNTLSWTRHPATTEAYQQNRRYIVLAYQCHKDIAEIREYLHQGAK